MARLFISFFGRPSSQAADGPTRAPRNGDRRSIDLSASCGHPHSGAKFADHAFLERMAERLFEELLCLTIQRASALYQSGSAQLDRNLFELRTGRSDQGGVERWAGHHLEKLSHRFSGNASDGFCKRQGLGLTRGIELLLEHLAFVPLPLPRLFKESRGLLSSRSEDLFATFLELVVNLLTRSTRLLSQGFCLGTQALGLLVFFFVPLALDVESAAYRLGKCSLMGLG